MNALMLLAFDSIKGNMKNAKPMQKPSSKNESSNAEEDRILHQISGLMKISKALAKASSVLIVALVFIAKSVFGIGVPAAQVSIANRITDTSAHLNCRVNPNGLATTVVFEYGKTNSYGTSKTISGTISGTITLFRSIQIAGLKRGETYHYRIKAENSAGTTYSEDMWFVLEPKRQFAGTYHSLVIDKSGVLYSFGRNDYKQLGTGSTLSSVATPNKVLSGDYSGSDYLGGDKSNKVVQVAAGTYHSLALTSKGELYTFGYNDKNQTSPSAFSNISTPKRVLKGEYEKINSSYQFLGQNPNNPILAIEAGRYYSLILVADGTVYGLGNATSDWIYPFNSSGFGLPYKINSVGNVFLGSNTNNPVLDIAGGPEHALALMSDGTVYSFGLNNYGQRGLGHQNIAATAQLVLKGAYSGTVYLGDNISNPIVGISAGQYFSLVRTKDGKVMAFGQNSYLQFGNGTNVNSSAPVFVLKGNDYSGSTYLGDNSANKVVQIAAGYTHSLCVVENGAIYAWGSNANKQLGIATLSNPYTDKPLLVDKGDYIYGNSLGASVRNKGIMVTSGAYYSMGITNDGHVYAFGDNYYKQLAHQSGISNIEPKICPIIDIRKGLIANGSRPIDNENELSVIAGESADSALQDAGDSVYFQISDKEFVEVETDISSLTNVVKRYDRTWKISYTDVNNNGGLIDLTFTINASIDRNFTYFLLFRDGSNGNFSCHQNHNFTINDEAITFHLDLKDLPNNKYYTLGHNNNTVGNALSCDGVDDYISIEHPDSLLSPNTFMFWIKTTDDNAILFDSPIEPISLGKDPLGYDKFSSNYGGVQIKLVNGYIISEFIDDKLRFAPGSPFMSELDTNKVISSIKVNDGRWYHITIVKNNNIKLYINSIFADEYQKYDVLYNTPLKADLSENIKIRQELKLFDGLSGQIDAFKLFWKELSDSEIVAEMASNGSGFNPDLELGFNYNGGVYHPTYASKGFSCTLENFSNSPTSWVGSSAPDLTGGLEHIFTEKPKTGLEFDGDDDFVPIGVKVGTEFTIEAWVNHNQSSGTNGIMGPNTGDLNFYPNRLPPFIRVIDSSNLQVGYGNGSTVMSETINNVLPKGEWTHVAWSCDQNGSTFIWKIYVDGLLVKEITKSGGNYDYAIRALGQYGSENYIGELDEVRLWKTVKTQDNIRECMFRNVDANSPDLEAYYNMDQTGTDLIDLTGNGYDGALTNFGSTTWVDAQDRDPHFSIRDGLYNDPLTWNKYTVPTSTDNVVIHHNVTVEHSGACRHLYSKPEKILTVNAALTINNNVYLEEGILGSSSVILAGDKNQILDGVLSFPGIEITNSTEVILRNDITINGVFEPLSSILYLNDFDLSINGSGGHGSASGYVKINGTGIIKAKVGASAVTIPIGKSDYSPITLKNGDDAIFTLDCYDKIYNSPGYLVNELTEKAVSNQWVVTPSKAVTGLSVTLGWEQGQELSNFDSDYASMASAFLDNYPVAYVWTKHGVASVTTTNGINFHYAENIELEAETYYFGIGSDDSPYGETIYKIESGNLSTTRSELTLSTIRNLFGNPLGAIKDAGDKVVLAEMESDFTETTNDIPSNTNAAFRYNRSWKIDVFDINDNSGTIFLTFDLGNLVNPDYTYYLINRNSTSGDFNIVNNLNYSIVGNTVVFKLELEEIIDGNYYTLGRSDNTAGYCLDFDGTNDYLVMDNIANEIAANDATFEAWFISNSNSKAHFAIQADKTTDKVVVYRNGVYDPSNGLTAYTNPISDSKWHHYVLLCDAGIGYKVYIDGSLEADVSYSSLAFASTDLISIGQKWATNESQFLSGQVDEVRVWSTLRTETEFKKFIFRPLIGNESNLVAYYRFDQSAESYLPDVSFNSYQGSLVNFGLSGSNSNWIESTAPIVSKDLSHQLMGPGNALDFDGTNDYVSITNLNLGTEFTIEAWINHNNTSTSGSKALFGRSSIATINRPPTVYMRNSNELAIGYGDGTNYNSKIYTTDIEKNNWHHIAWSCEYITYATRYSIINAYQWKVYLDGILVGLDTIFNASENTYINVIGRQGSSYFNGLLDEMRFWGDVRTQVEIQDNMYATLEGDEDDLLAYYDFDNSSGTNIEDKSSNSHDGTLYYMSSPSCWVSAIGREPYKTVRPGNQLIGSTWKNGTAPTSAGDKLAIFHDITLNATKTYSRFQVNSGKTVTSDADITVSGEVIVNGTTGGSNKIILAGSSKQKLGGSGKLKNLQINNSNDISLEGDLEIDGSLTLTDGDIEINDHTLTLSGTTSHGNADSYLKLNRTGSVKTTVGSNPVILPIGRNPYLPIIIENGGGAEFTVGVADGVYNDPTTSTTELTNEVVSETWSIQASSAVNEVTLEIGWDAGQESSLTRTACGIGYWENGVSSVWQKPDNTTAATGSDPYFQSRTMDFSTNLYYFGVGGPSSPLPVELTYFTAHWQEQGKSTQLNWQTAMEENNSHFEIERSFDGQTWEQIGRAEGAGNSISVHSYQFTDNGPLSTVNGEQTTVYYRLKQIDFDNSFEYSPVRTLNSNLATRNSISVYPNPTSNWLNVKSNTAIQSLKVYDLQGKVVIEATETNRINLENLLQGTYIIEIDSDQYTTRKKIMVN